MNHLADFLLNQLFIYSEKVGTFKTNVFITSIPIIDKSIDIVTGQSPGSPFVVSPKHMIAPASHLARIQRAIIMDDANKARSMLFAMKFKVMVENISSTK